jgi:hypothetical protein
MSDEKTFTEAEAHLHFAKQYNGKTWDLLDKPDRTKDEDERMLDYAHASLAHWRVAGTAVHHQRGEWMIARVHTALGNGGQALRHARRVADLTDSHKSEMSDFDFAFAYECLARAYALNGEKAEAEKIIGLAQKAGEAIADKEDRDIFFADFNGGAWYGVK